MPVGLRPDGARRVARGAGGLLGLGATVELASRLELVDAASLPPASAILGTTAGLLVDPAFLGHVAATLLACALGLVLALALAVPLGLALGSSRRAEVAGMTIIDLLRPIPSVALVPLVILLVGRGLDMKVLLVAYAAAWPILVNTAAGVRSVDPVARDTAVAYGLDRRARIRHLVLPSAAPFVATGLRISASIALILAISAELIAGGSAGLGTWMLANSQAGIPRELLYAGIVVAGVLGIGINAALMAGERRVLAWHVAMTAGR